MLYDVLSTGTQNTLKYHLLQLNHPLLSKQSTVCIRQDLQEGKWKG